MWAVYQGRVRFGVEIDQDGVIFCLRGMKTSFGNPHRNFVDFSHVPVVKRLTRMPVCVDPSHSVGVRDKAPDGLLEIF
ncbi:MAG: hypothetical protein P8Z41_15740, partial [Anaerolineales bacterium]